MTKRIFIACCLIFAVGIYTSAQTCSRVPARRDSVEVLQPNGAKLWIYLRGDEWKHESYTTDGYLLKTNKKGFYCYAKQNKYEQIVPSNRKAKNKNERSKWDWLWLSKIESNPALHRQMK